MDETMKWIFNKLENIRTLGIIAFIGFPGVFLSHHTYSSGLVIFDKPWNPVFALGIGSSSVSAINQSQSFPIQNPITDEFYEYTAQHSSRNSALFEIFIGAESDLNARWKIQPGVDFNTTPRPFSAEGIFVQGADVQSADVFGYHFNAVSQQLMASAKLLYQFHSKYHPYVFAGLGASFNRAYNYHTTVPYYLTFTRMYQDNTHTSLSYSLGLGVDVAITSSMRFGLGYRYTDLGSLKLGNAFIDTTQVSGTLTNAKLHSNQFLVQATWIFNQDK